MKLKSRITLSIAAASLLAVQANADVIISTGSTDSTDYNEILMIFDTVTTPFTYSGDITLTGFNAIQSGASSLITTGTITLDNNDIWGYGVLIGTNNEYTNSGDINVTSSIDNSTTIGLYNSSQRSGAGSTINAGNIAVNISGVNSTAYALYLYSSVDADSAATVNIDEGKTVSATKDGVLSADAYSLFTWDDGGIINVTNDGSMLGNIGKSSTDNPARLNLTNNGLVSLPYDANNIDTNTKAARVDTFVNSSTGTLEIGLETDGTVAGSTYSQLVTTDATFEDGSTINVDVLSSSTNVSSLSGTLENVVQTDSNLTINGILYITDNSDLIDFTYVNNDSNISLVAALAEDAPELNPISHVAAAQATSQMFDTIHNIVELRQREEGKGMNSGDTLSQDKNFWFKPFYSYGKQSNADGLNGFDVKARGIGAGVDTEIKEGYKMGIGLFYTAADIDVNNVTNQIDATNLTALLYGSMRLSDEKTTFMYQLGYSRQENDASRTASSDLYTADYTSYATAVDLKWMREYTLSNGMEAKPLLEAKLRRFSTPSYEEESATGVDGYSVQKSTYNQAILSVGSYFENKIDEKSKFITDLRAGYDFQHDDNTVSAAYTLLQDYTTSNGIDNGGLVYKAGFAYEVDQDDIIFNIGYDLNGQGSDYQNHMLSAKALYKF